MKALSAGTPIRWSSGQATPRALWLLAPLRPAYRSASEVHSKLRREVYMHVQANHLPNALRPIRVLSAPAAAADALRSAILDGNLKPGERLIEQTLARRLRIGQPTLREALKELEYQGFVRKGLPRGTYVTKLARADFRSILEVRMALETLAIEKAAPHLTPEAEKTLAALVEGMGLAARNFDLNSFHRIDVAFHRQVWALADNPYLTEALELVAFRLFAFVVIQRGRDSRNEFLHATEQHRAILAGLATQDAATARQAFVSSTLRFWNDHHGVKLNGCSPGSSLPHANGVANGASTSVAIRDATNQVKE